jgi:signal transduction histidine kinase
MLALERAQKKLAMSEQLEDYTENLQTKMDECKLDLRQAQDELIKTERLSTIGETVAGLAHCIKNVLSGMGGGMYMVHTGMAKEKADMLEEGWAMFQRNVERITDLILDLLRYSRQTLPERAACSPNKLLSEVVRSFETQAARHSVKLNEVLDPNLVEADLERDNIRRALVHLVSNAIDACIYDAAASKVWEVTVKTRLETDAGSGETVLFEVTDNGCGMTDEVKGKLFTRFFSTKAGRGTGIGLLVTQKIIHEHGGEILVESKAGEGTTVSVRLPAHT